MRNAMVGIRQPRWEGTYGHRSSPKIAEICIRNAMREAIPVLSRRNTLHFGGLAALLGICGKGFCRQFLGVETRIAMESG